MHIAILERLCLSLERDWDYIIKFVLAEGEVFSQKNLKPRNS